MRKPSDAKEPATAWQLRAARAAANISAQELAALSGLSVNTIRRAEQAGMAPMSKVNKKALIAALAELGAELGVEVDGAAAIVFRPASSEDEAR